MHVPRLLGRTARMRLTLLYGGAFLLCGAVLLVLIYLSFAATAPARSGSDGVANAAATATAVRQSGLDVHALLVVLGFALAVTTVAAVALGWFIAGRVLRPLAVITAAARQISAHSLHERGWRCTAPTTS
jgi:hypothetical protein